MVGDICEFENVIPCPNATPSQLLGASVRNLMSGPGSVSGWVGVRGRQVGWEGDCGKSREGWHVVIPSIPSWPRGTPSSTGPGRLQ